MTSIALPLFSDVVTPSQKATRSVRQDLTLLKLCCLSGVDSLFSMCLSIDSRRIYSIMFTGVEMHLAGQWFPGSSFAPVIKLDTTFHWRPPGLSVDCQYFSNILQSHSATTSANVFRNLGCPSTGPVDLCMFVFLWWSSTWCLSPQVLIQYSLCSDLYRG